MYEYNTNLYRTVCDVEWIFLIQGITFVNQQQNPPMEMCFLGK